MGPKEEAAQTMNHQASKVRPRAVRLWAGLLFLAGVLLWTWAGAASAQGKFGVVDMGRVLRESEPGKTALVALQGTSKQFQDQMIVKTQSLARQEQALRELQQDIRQKSLLYSEEVRQQKEEEFRQKQREFTRDRDSLVRFRREVEADFNRKRRRATSKVQREIRDVVNRIGKKEKFTIILERSRILFFDSRKIDLTDKVIRTYNQAKR